MSERTQTIEDPQVAREKVTQRVGKLTEKLIARANKLEKSSKVYEPVTFKGEGGYTVQTGGLDNVRETTDDDTHIRTRTRYGNGKITVSKTDPETGVETYHEAQVNKAGASSRADHDHVQYAHTETREVDDHAEDAKEKYKNWSVSGRRRKESDYFMRKDAKPAELYTADPDQGYRSDSDRFLGEVNSDPDTTEELTDRAVSHAAKTLGSIRGAIVDAEIRASEELEKPEQ